MNKAIICGHIGKEPETHTVGETTVTNFSVATTEGRKNKAGEWENVTEWHNISAWGLSSFLLGALHKGSKVLIEGKICTQSYTDNNNVAKTKTHIVARSVSFLDKVENASRPIDKKPIQQPMADDISDDIPF